MSSLHAFLTDPGLPLRAAGLGIIAALALLGWTAGPPLARHLTRRPTVISCPTCHGARRAANGAACLTCGGLSYIEVKP